MLRFILTLKQQVDANANSNPNPIHRLSLRSDKEKIASGALKVETVRDSKYIRKNDPKPWDENKG
jgi:hypothetical protein